MNMKDVKSIGARLAAGQKARQAVIDANAIRELSELLTETGLTEIEIEQNGARIRVARHAGGGGTAPANANAAPQAGAAAEPVKAKGPAAGAVSSPMVGTVYVAPTPGAPPFVRVGQTVKEGDTLLIVEAMKTMNPILAPHGGTVREICVSDVEPVEFGQILLIIS
jgi:acetyl-CoA carboxylase biotin carboxyl carrier protein